MAYSDFTVRRVKKEFGIQTQEGGRFLPVTPDIEPSQMLTSILENYVPWAIAVGSEKAKSETIVAPVLLEIKQILHSKISVFSGRDFSVDAVPINSPCPTISPVITSLSNDCGVLSNMRRSISSPTTQSQKQCRV